MEEKTAIRLLRAAQEVVQDARPATEHGIKDADLVVVDREYVEGLQAVVQEISDAAVRVIEEVMRRPIHPPAMTEERMDLNVCQWCGQRLARWRLRALLLAGFLVGGVATALLLLVARLGLSVGVLASWRVWLPLIPLVVLCYMAMRVFLRAGEAITHHGRGRCWGTVGEGDPGRPIQPSV